RSSSFTLFPTPLRSTLLQASGFLAARSQTKLPPVRTSGHQHLRLKSLLIRPSYTSWGGRRQVEVLFKWDLRWCPVFSKLKTLVLNEYWCMPDDFGPLGPKYEVDMKGSISPMEQSTTISEHLNIVKVKCQAVDERVLKILKLLCTFNIYSRLH
ncbi:uncharacterized protein, partial [Miscanthus floridulus]|uniref:uncharacterized protein n=1 Tax=Miscanthus floridulus TaxID=154761 RepID=UPI003459EABF